MGPPLNLPKHLRQRKGPIPIITTAYYFRQHMYSLVPRHVREDMAWMADIGTTSVSLAVLEQDFDACPRNIEIVAKEAERVGISLFATPSRWGGRTAGAPKAPSYFTATHPETWVLDKQGKPIYTTPAGPASSIHHPATVEFFCRSVERLLTLWPVAGIIWDEPKLMHVEDHSPAAQAAAPPDADLRWHQDAFARFFDRVGAHARSIKPDVTLSMFMPAMTTGYLVERFSAIENLDYFGCDGRPWSIADSQRLEGRDKALLGQAERFIAAAKQNGKGGLMLLENHNMPTPGYEVMGERLPDVLRLGAEHILYYYYPRNNEDPDRQMAILGAGLKAHLRPPA